MSLTDDELLAELAIRFSQSRKTFSDLNVVNHKLIELNRKLEDSEALRTNFLSNIRNEILNPLSSITGLASQILLVKHDEERAKLVSMICSEAENLDFQLRNIFTAAALEAGDVSPRITRVATSDAIRGVTELFSRTAAAAKLVDIQLDLPEEPLLVATDREKLEIIFANLLSNAIEYSRQCGVVSVCGRLDERGALVLSVSDQGAGIAAENQRRIFDRFTQLETGTTRTHHGHGLGLCIIRSLVDLLGGTVSLKSAIDQGATFLVTIPPSSFPGDELAADDSSVFFFDDLSEK